ncbi:hypothetical protein QJS66_12015 [Kocuria rhizophila]|nr:hypothetical protein QJS66_12015 [Kocuria rhizophila]
MPRLDGRGQSGARPRRRATARVLTCPRRRGGAGSRQGADGRAPLLRSGAPHPPRRGGRRRHAAGSGVRAGAGRAASCSLCHRRSPLVSCQ